MQKRSGHSSIKALQIYEQVTPQQGLAVSKILQSDKKLTFKAATQNVSNGDIDNDGSFSGSGSLTSLIFLLTSFD